MARASWVGLVYPSRCRCGFDRWLVAQRPRAEARRDPEILEAGLVRSSTDRANGPKTPLRPGDAVQLWMPHRRPLPYLAAGGDLRWMLLYEDAPPDRGSTTPAGLDRHPAPATATARLGEADCCTTARLPGMRRSSGGRGIACTGSTRTPHGCIVVAKKPRSLVNCRWQIRSGSFSGLPEP